MRSRLMGWLAAGLAAMAFALLYLTNKADRAYHRAEQAERQRDRANASSQQQRTLEKARHQVREQAEELTREADDRPAEQRPSGSLRR
jgi:Flp pilus assembly protein TadB